MDDKVIVYTQKLILPCYTIRLGPSSTDLTLLAQCTPLKTWPFLNSSYSVGAVYSKRFLCECFGNVRGLPVIGVDLLKRFGVKVDHTDGEGVEVAFKP